MSRLSGSNDGTARLVDYQMGKLITTFAPKRGHVLSVAFSPDGILALTGCADNAVQLWDVASGQLKHEFVTGSSALAVAFSPDGTQVLIGLEAAQSIGRLGSPMTGSFTLVITLVDQRLLDFLEAFRGWTLR